MSRCAQSIVWGFTPSGRPACGCSAPLPPSPPPLLPLFCGHIRGSVQDMYDEQTGRKVRKARKAAATAIAEHAKWVAHNPYRLAENGAKGGGPDKAEDDDGGGPVGDGDDGDAFDWETEAEPSRSRTNGADTAWEKRGKSKRLGLDDGDDGDAFGAKLCAHLLVHGPHVCVWELVWCCAGAALAGVSGADGDGRMVTGGAVQMISKRTSRITWIRSVEAALATEIATSPATVCANEVLACRVGVGHKHNCAMDIKSSVNIAVCVCLFFKPRELWPNQLAKLPLVSGAMHWHCQPRHHGDTYVLRHEYPQDVDKAACSCTRCNL